MIYTKKLTSQEVLEAITSLVLETLPEGKVGDVHASYDEENGIEVVFIETDRPTVQN